MFRLIIMAFPEFPETERKSQNQIDITSVKYQSLEEHYID
jgi:hypothetical protein